MNPCIDDFLFMVWGFQRAQEAESFVFNLFQSLCFAISKKKGVWEPTRTLGHHGMIVDSKEMTFKVPEKTLQNISAWAKEFLSRARTHQWRLPVKTLAKSAGKAQPLHLAIPVSKLCMRKLFSVMFENLSWSSNAKASKQLLRNLKWWTAALAEKNGSHILQMQEFVFLNFDSSRFGCGAVLDGQKVARGYWLHQRQTAAHHMQGI